MTTRKKQLALLLAMTIAIGLLTACGNTADSNTETITTTPSEATAGTDNTLDSNATTAPTINEDDGPTTPPLPEPLPEAQVGDVLQVPDAAGYPEWLGEYDEYRFEFLDALGIQYIYARRHDFATGVTETYMVDDYNNDECIWRAYRGTYEQYTRSTDEDPFMVNGYWDSTSYETDMTYVDNEIFFFLQYAKPIDNTHYVKMGDVEAPTGTACAYEIYENNVLTGYLWIDKATGIMVCKIDTNNKIQLQITYMSLEDAGIPEY